MDYGTTDHETTEGKREFGNIQHSTFNIQHSTSNEGERGKLKLGNGRAKIEDRRLKMVGTQRRKDTKGGEARPTEQGGRAAARPYRFQKLY
jgi:hypothetical protein